MSVLSPGYILQQSPGYVMQKSPGYTLRSVPVVPLCKTPEERQFVGTLVAVVMYQSHDQLGLRPVELISITDNQLRQVTALRVDLEVPPWDNPTKISRIKRKYVSR